MFKRHKKKNQRIFETNLRHLPSLSRFEAPAFVKSLTADSSDEEKVQIKMDAFSQVCYKLCGPRTAEL